MESDSKFFQLLNYPLSKVVTANLPSHFLLRKSLDDRVHRIIFTFGSLRKRMSMKNQLLIALSAIALTISVHAQELTLEDIWRNGTYQQRSVYGQRSMKDGKHYTAIERNEQGTSISKYSYKSGDKTETILSDQTFQKYAGNSEVRIEGYHFSDDEKMLLIEVDAESIYRYSSQAQFYLVDLKAKTASPIAGNEKQRNATFSPDGAHVAFVQDNNIHIINFKNGEIMMVTNDGEKNKIINGYADWVYEEEFAFNKAFFWSPDGSKIAYYKFDESEVKEFNMPIFSGLYPEDYKFKYPKAGEENSKVSIHIYDLKTKQNTTLNLGNYEYIPRIKWTQSSEYLAVMTMPRLQNQLDIKLVNTNDFSSQTVYTEASRTYIEISDDLTFFGNNAGFIWRSEKDGFFHLYRYDFNGGNATQITAGEWEVKSFLGLDEKNSRLYFEAGKNSPENTAVYAVGLDGGEPEILSPELGTSHAKFSTTFDYFLLYHSTTESPLRVSLHKSNGNQIRVLEENTELRKKLEALNLPATEFISVPSADGNNLNAWMIKPKDFDPKKKYPVLMHVYGGPGSQTVTNAMGGNFLWHHLMAQKGYIIVSVDNRGTGARGKAFRDITYRQLGKYETDDQISAAKWLASLNFVDGERIGIWGWSYGGYMSSLCLFKGAEHFKTAVAVAPVSNWRFYDSIYTERYMGTPQDNASGYDDNSPINHVEKMQGNYLLIHGTADDNVHFQNAVEMVDALIAADKQFDFYIYPDRNHGIYGGNTRYHLFSKMTNFLIENL